MSVVFEKIRFFIKAGFTCSFLVNNMVELQNQRIFAEVRAFLTDTGISDICLKKL